MLTLLSMAFYIIHGIFGSNHRQSMRVRFFCFTIYCVECLFGSIGSRGGSEIDVLTENRFTSKTNLLEK